MQVIRIRVSDRIYDKFLWLLKSFRGDEIEVIEENEIYDNIKSDLKSDLKKIDENKEKFITLDEFENQLDKVISKNESTSN